MKIIRYSRFNFFPLGNSYNRGSTSNKKTSEITLLDKIKLLTETSTSVKVYRLTNPKLSDRCFLIESSSARQILTDHFLVGLPLITKCAAAVKNCLSAYFTLQKRSIQYHQMAEVVPLSGSLTYNLLKSFYDLYNHSLARNFIGIRRFLKPDGKWDTEVSYTNFEALNEDLKVIFIGDTIATGVTITKVIQIIQAQLQVPLTFVIISIAGSLIGAQRIVQLEEKLQKNFPETEIWCLFTEAYFGLEANGTDMPILHPDTISTPQLQQLAHEQLGEYLGRNLCSVLDWGKRTNAPFQHYRELIHTLKALKEKKIESPFISEMISRCQNLVYSP